MAGQLLERNTRTVYSEQDLTNIQRRLDLEEQFSKLSLELQRRKPINLRIQIMRLLGIVLELEELSDPTTQPPQH